MKANFGILTWMGMFALAAFGLYLVKYDTQHTQKTIAQLEASLHAERESLRLLKVEWSYLNRPERLEVLGAHFVPMQALTSGQMIEVHQLPPRMESGVQDANAKANAASTASPLFQPVGGQ
jgi:hypothetical protein